MNKLQTVLDALEKAKRQVIHANVAPHGCINEAITVVHELMAQEPVAWYDSDMDSAYTASELDGGSEEGLTPSTQHQWPCKQCQQSQTKW